MPRIGELVVAAGLLTVEQVEQALRAQVLWGGRLGTNLVELHRLELDPLARMLGRQHRLPAALARHFEKADPELQRLLAPDLADRFSCVPLLRMGPEQHVVIASIAPLPPGQLAIIARELGVDVKRLLPAIAPELRIRYQLERVYRLRRAARYLRARGKTIPPFPAFQILPVHIDLALDLSTPSLPVSTREMEVFRLPSDPPSAPEALELDDLSRQALDAVPTGPLEAESTGRQRRTYVRTIADAPPADTEHQALVARIAIRRIAVGSAPRVMAGATLDEATRAIRRSTGRDRVADLVIDTLDRFTPACEAAILLVIRGATAIGWKGFQRGGGALGEIAVPMEDGGLLSWVVEQAVALRRSGGARDELDRLLLASLGQPAGDLVVVPIAIAEQVLCVIAIATAPDAAVAGTEAIAAAAGAAFARLMRDASR